MHSIVYPIADRPDVEVNVAGTWHYGQLRMSTRHDDGPGRHKSPGGGHPART